MMIGCNAAHGVRIGRISRRRGSGGGRTRTTVTQIVHGWSHRTMRLPGRCGHGRDNTLNSLTHSLRCLSRGESFVWAHFPVVGRVGQFFNALDNPTAMCFVARPVKYYAAAAASMLRIYKISLYTLDGGPARQRKSVVFVCRRTVFSFFHSRNRF